MSFVSDILLLFLLTVVASLISFFAFAMSVNHSRSKNNHSFRKILVEASTEIKKLQRDWADFKFLTGLRAFMVFLTFYSKLKRKNAIGTLDMWIVRALLFFLACYSSVGLWDVAYEFLKWLNNK